MIEHEYSYHLISFRILSAEHERDLLCPHSTKPILILSTVSGLKSALKWLKTTDADNLLYGDPFDRGQQGS